jgi:uncharacterized protein with PIN domain
VTTTHKFIVDHNVGKLARWLRLMGYDTLMFGGGDDTRMVSTALAQGRVILTRDTQIMKRRVVTSGRLAVVLIQSEQPEVQATQVIGALGLDCQFRPFSLCLECNLPLEERRKEEVKDLVPPFVFRTHNQYKQCPSCRRIYWQGTHWEAMTKKLASLGKG